MNIIETFESKQKELKELEKTSKNFHILYGKIILEKLGFVQINEYSNSIDYNNDIYIYYLHLKNKNGDIEINCDYFRLIFRLDNKKQSFEYEISLRDMGSLSKDSFQKYMSKYLILNDNIENLEFDTLRKIADKHISLNQNIKNISKKLKKIETDYFKLKNELSFRHINNVFPKCTTMIELEELIKLYSVSFVNISFSDNKIVLNENTIHYTGCSERTSFTLNGSRVSKSKALELLNSRILFNDKNLKKVSDIPFLEIKRPHQYYREFDFELNEFVELVKPFSNIKEF